MNYSLPVVSTNILPSFRADYSSKEGAVEAPIFEIFGSKSLDITPSERLGVFDYPRKKVKQDFTLALFRLLSVDITRFFVQDG